MAMNWKNEYKGETVYEVEQENVHGGGATLQVFTSMDDAMNFANPYCKECSEDKTININTYIWVDNEYVYFSGFGYLGHVDSEEA